MNVYKRHPFFRCAGSIMVGFSLLVVPCAYADSSMEMPRSELVELDVPLHEADTNTIKRNAVLVTYPEAKGTILICHGFMCDKYDVGFLRTLFPRGQYNFLTFDFRAHGENSKGQCCTFGLDEAQDVIAAAHFLRGHTMLKGKPLYVYGFSMGAVASIEAQAKDKSLFDAMILDCPFDSTERVLTKSIDRLKCSIFGYQFDMPGKNILRKYVFHPYVQSFLKILLQTFVHIDMKHIQIYMSPLRPSESAKKIDIPCLFIHCKNDEKVPVESIKIIFDKAHGYKKLWLTNGRRHFDSLFYNPEGYADKINKFLNKVETGKVYAKATQAKIVEDPQQ